MKHAAPPSAATWLLERWSFGGRNDSLAGDLLEEFHSGRTSGWYWRQVLAALSSRGSREVFTHRAVLLFAVLWSMLVPLWLLAVAAIGEAFQSRRELPANGLPLVGCMRRGPDACGQHCLRLDGNSCLSHSAFVGAKDFEVQASCSGNFGKRSCAHCTFSGSDCLASIVSSCACSQPVTLTGSRTCNH